MTTEPGATSHPPPPPAIATSRIERVPFIVGITEDHPDFRVFATWEEYGNFAQLFWRPKMQILFIEAKSLPAAIAKCQALVNEGSASERQQAALVLTLIGDERGEPEGPAPEPAIATSRRFAFWRWGNSRHR